MYKDVATSTPDTVASPSNRSAYGSASGCRPAIQALARQVAGLLDTFSIAEIPAATAAVLADFLGEADLLCTSHRAGSGAGYRRHLLYADPLRRFSIVSVVWAPGQSTPVHGHAAWGAFGVWQGELTLTHFRLAPGAAALEIDCAPYCQHVARPGQVATSRTGISDLHAIANCRTTTAISVHVYGQDLLADSSSLNIVLPH